MADKWAAFNALSPYMRGEVERIARQAGVTLDADSTAEEIARFVRMAKAGW